jgi:hypothetical protein
MKSEKYQIFLNESSWVDVGFEARRATFSIVKSFLWRKKKKL